MPTYDVLLLLGNNRYHAWKNRALFQQECSRGSVLIHLGVVPSLFK